MQTVIELQNVSKTFRDKKAVDAVSLSVYKGETVAVLGANGAGKTTLISLMLGLLRPTSGEVSVFGKSVDKVRDKIGAMLQQSSVMDDVKVKELIDLIRSYYPRPYTREKLLRMVKLEKEEKLFAQKLSGGQKRRLSFALAIAGNPDLIFLDEPTVGMDVTSRKLFWNEIEALKRTGKTVLLTTHYLEEVERTADRIVMLNKGKKVFEGDLLSIQRTFTNTAVTFLWNGDSLSVFERGFPYVREIQRMKDRVYLYTDNSDALLCELFTRGLPVSDVLVEKGSLNEWFDQLTKEEQSDESVVHAI